MVTLSTSKIKLSCIVQCRAVLARQEPLHLIHAPPQIIAISETFCGKVAAVGQDPTAQPKLQSAGSPQGKLDFSSTVVLTHVVFVHARTAKIAGQKLMISSFLLNQMNAGPSSAGRYAVVHPVADGAVTKTDAQLVQRQVHWNWHKQVCANQKKVCANGL